MTSFQRKLAISLGSAGLFALVSLPSTYALTNKLFGTGLCPSPNAILLHLIVFLLVSFATMRGGYPTGLKAKFTFYGGLMYFLISSPTMYKFTRNLFGAKIASSSGCPTVSGVLLHAAVYTALLTAAMYLP